MPSSKITKYVSGSKATSNVAASVDISSYARGTTIIPSHADIRSDGKGSRGGSEIIIEESCFIATQESTAATL